MRVILYIENCYGWGERPFVPPFLFGTAPAHSKSNSPPPLMIIIILPCCPTNEKKKKWNLVHLSPFEHDKISYLDKLQKKTKKQKTYLKNIIYVHFERFNVPNETYNSSINSFLCFSYIYIYMYIKMVLSFSISDKRRRCLKK